MNYFKTSYRRNDKLVFSWRDARGRFIKVDMGKALEEDAYKFYEKAKNHEILVVPCDDFGVKGYVRRAYCTDNAMVKRALPAFKKLAEEYKK